VAQVFPGSPFFCFLSCILHSAFCIQLRDEGSGGDVSGILIIPKV